MAGCPNPTVVPGLLPVVCPYLKCQDCYRFREVGVLQDQIRAEVTRLYHFRKLTESYLVLLCRPNDLSLGPYMPIVRVNIAFARAFPRIGKSIF